MKSTTGVLKWLLETSGQAYGTVGTNEVQPQVPEDAKTIDEMVRGPEDPIRTFIDKLTDVKNKELGETSKQEIQKLINNA